MKTNSPAAPIDQFMKKITRLFILLLAFCLLSTQRGFAAGDEISGPRVFLNASSTRVLMIGDSMTVGTFGEVMQDYLLTRYGKYNVALYASCGSSPQHWRSGPVSSPYGYRELSPYRTALLDFVDRRPPPRVTRRLKISLRDFTLYIYH